MSQTRRQSAFESVINVFVGYWVAVAATAMIFPVFGIPIDTQKNLIISGCFTVISLLRSYALRRFFNWWHA